MKNIRNEKDYTAASNRLNEIFYALPDTSEGYEAETLVNLMIKYEKKYFAIDDPSPSSKSKKKKSQL